MTIPRHQYLWLDLETTGLNPFQNRILEWAVVLAADDAGGDMSSVQEFSSVIGIGQDDLSKEMDDFVTKMHTRNGLLEECRASDTTLAESEAFLVDLCTELAGPNPTGIVLAGGSVHFDLGFVRAHMPKFARCLSHRVFDVSTLKAAERTWGEPLGDIKSDVHRALPDARASLAEAAAYRIRRYGQVAA